MDLTIQSPGRLPLMMSRVIVHLIVSIALSQDEARSQAVGCAFTALECARYATHLLHPWYFEAPMMSEGTPRIVSMFYVLQ